MKELIIAVLIDYILGDPYWLPHPIVLIGNIIKKYESMIRKTMIHLKIGGYILTILTILTVIAVTTLILFITGVVHPIFNSIVTIYLLYTSLAARCLQKEAVKVYASLDINDLIKGRKQLSYLVGRDTSQLSKKEIIRGAVETVAENTIDGILAPIFYIIVGYLIGVPVQMVFLYKTVNTLDSMVGYMNDKYREIGYASAKLDDIANYIPSRLGSILMLLAGGLLNYDLKNGFKILKRDRRNHKSPNCGYPESVVAGLLGIQIGGTNKYFGERVYKPTIGDNKRPLEPVHIKDAIRIMYGAQLLVLFVIVIAILFI